MQRANEEKEQKVALLEEGKTAVEVENSDLRSTLRRIETCQVEFQRELEDSRRQVRHSF